MNEEGKWMQWAQEYFDAMPQGERERFEGEMRSSWEAAAQELGLDPEDPEDLEGETSEQIVRKMCIIHLARTMIRGDAWASEFVTEELIERYTEEEFDRLVKLPEYAPGGSVPEDVLDEAILARLVSEHPAAARHPSAPE